jgi:hypothetical protein
MNNGGTLIHLLFLTFSVINSLSDQLTQCSIGPDLGLYRSSHKNFTQIFERKIIDDNLFLYLI